MCKASELNALQTNFILDHVKSLPFQRTELNDVTVKNRPPELCINAKLAPPSTLKYRKSSSRKISQDPTQYVIFRVLTDTFEKYFKQY